MSKPLKYPDLTNVIMISIAAFAVMCLINLHDAHPAAFQALMLLVVSFMAGSLIIFRFSSWVMMWCYRDWQYNVLLRMATVWYGLIGLTIWIPVNHYTSTAKSLAIFIGYCLGAAFGREVMKVEQERKGIRPKVKA